MYCGVCEGYVVPRGNFRYLDLAFVRNQARQRQWNFARNSPTPTSIHSDRPPTLHREPAGLSGVPTARCASGASYFESECNILRVSIAQSQSVNCLSRNGPHALSRDDQTRAGTMCDRAQSTIRDREAQIKRGAMSSYEVMITDRKRSA